MADSFKIGTRCVHIATLLHLECVEIYGYNLKTGHNRSFSLT